MRSPAAPRRNREGVLEIQKVPAAEQACNKVQRSKSKTVEIAQWVGHLPGMQPARQGNRKAHSLCATNPGWMPSISEDAQSPTRSKS